MPERIKYDYENISENDTKLKDPMQTLGLFVP